MLVDGHSSRCLDQFRALELFETQEVVNQVSQADAGHIALIADAPLIHRVYDSGYLGKDVFHAGAHGGFLLLF